MIPEASPRNVRLGIRIESMAGLHEAVFVEKVKQLAAMEFDRVDEIDGVVKSRQRRFHGSAKFRPVNTVDGAIEEEGLGDEGWVASVLVGEKENSAGE